MSHKTTIAASMQSMSYGELTELADDLVSMQIEAKASGEFRWKMNETYGEYGLARMLAVWSENVVADETEKLGLP